MKRSITAGGTALISDGVFGQVQLAIVPVHVPDSGLPWWQEVPLTILGCAIAFGILYLLTRLLTRRRK